jgi:glycine/D-amino acid oxidase-like deaminating enzyme
VTIVASLKTDPYWWEAAPPTDMPETDVAETCDVAIVGAGYTGLSAAVVLSRAGRSVQVFDSLRAGEGASTRNGGIASGNIRIGFGTLIERFGLERAKSIYAEGKLARERLSAFLDDEGISCDQQMVGRFAGAVAPKHFEAMRREADLLNKHVDLGVSVIARKDQHAELGTDYYYGGVVRPDIGGLHPGKFHAGLFNRASDAGATIHTSTAVQGVQRDGDGYTVRTARGTVRARDVLIGTNGYTDKANAWLQRRLVPVPSRIIVTEPIGIDVMARLMPKRRMLVESRRVGYYYRPTPDGTRILFGGREGDANASPEDVVRIHIGRLVEIFPELADIQAEFSWSGFVAYSRDYMPRLFSHDGMHYAVGYCGSGVVWAWWTGRHAAFQILGQGETESAFLCDPPKAIPLYAGKPWFLPTMMKWFGFQDRMDQRQGR